MEKSTLEEGREGRGLAVHLTWVYAELAPHYPTLGRPSVDPVLMIRMLIIVYVFGLRSERLLCRELQVSRAVKEYLATLDDAAFARLMSVLGRFC